MNEIAGYCNRCRKPVEAITDGMSSTIAGFVSGMVIKDGITVDPGKLYHLGCYQVVSADLPWKKKT